MTFTKSIALAAGLTLATIGSASAESLGMQSDWLELVKGQRCETSGAQIMNVADSTDTGHQTVLLRIPKASLEGDADMEEVRVVARMPEKAELPELLPELETEWIDDYDNDHYGLLVKLRSDQKVPIRLFMSSRDGFLDGAVGRP